MKKILLVGLLFGGMIYGNDKKVEEVILQMGFDAMECTLIEMAQVKPADNSEERKLFNIFWKRCVNKALGKVSFSERMEVGRYFEANRELAVRKLLEGAESYTETLTSPLWNLRRN